LDRPFFVPGFFVLVFGFESIQISQAKARKKSAAFLPGIYANFCTPVHRRAAHDAKKNQH
jgi:hypothetical protein